MIKRRKNGQFAKGSSGHVGYRAMVIKHFDGDVQAQREYFRQLGLWNYEQAAGIDNPAAWEAMHPGPIPMFMTAWRAVNYIPSTIQDVEFEF